MQVLPVTNGLNNQPQFKAKFLDTPALRKIAEWAVENNKFKELNEARKQISYTAVTTRIEMDLGTNLEGFPIAIFRRHQPKFSEIDDKFVPENFQVSRPVTYQSRRKHLNPLEYGYERIIQMGRFVTQNKMFREIVINPPVY